MRNAFAEEILEIARQDERLIVLSADIGNRLFDKLKAEFPSRFYNTGVAEANNISMAAGLAASGFRPVCYTITPFITYRCYEQIRIDVCYHEMPVVIVGTGSGLSYAALGATHHSCEDIAVMRVLPGIHVAAPADALEAKACLRAAFNLGKPAYIRIGKKGEPVIYGEVPAFKFGSWSVLRQGSDICLLSTGNMLEPALKIAGILANAKISASVVNCASIKPLDEEMLEKMVNSHDAVVTIEEHSLIGGFGGAVVEWVVDQNLDANKIIRFGTQDYFLHRLGEQEYARKQYGLGVHQITEKIVSFLKKHHDRTK
jgi:transketolase